MNVTLQCANLCSNVLNMQALCSVQISIQVYLISIKMWAGLSLLNSEILLVELIHYQDEQRLPFFIFVSLLSGGLLLKERICSFQSRFFSLRVDLPPFFEELCPPGKQTGSLKSCVPL